MADNISIVRNQIQENGKEISREKFMKKNFENFATIIFRNFRCEFSGLI
jgi:hypothetical protein